MQFVAPVSITSTPSASAPAPLPPAINSPTTYRPPLRPYPPKASTSNSPAEAAGALSDMTCASAPTMTPAMRLIVEVRALTGAGSSGLTRLPGGRCSEIGRKQPPLVGIFGSVRARTAQHAAASDPDGTQLNGPRTCGLVPVKSISI